MTSLFKTNLKLYKLSTFKLKYMRKLLIITLSIFTISTSFSQETKVDTLKTEEILVVKPYSPKISDAFKIKSNPSIDTATTIQKEKVKYSIFSIPVASTFTPSKGKAKGVKRAPKERLFENYISAGFGTYTSPLFEAYLHTGDPRYSDLGIFINHHSSEGGIKDLQLNDSFADTRFDGFYKFFDKYYNWQINAGVQRKLYNYYGTRVTFEDAILNTIDEKQIYKNIYVGGNVDFKDSFFKGGTTELSRFTDDEGSTETHVLIQPKIEFSIASEYINANVRLEYLTEDFFMNYARTANIEYSFFTVGFNPNFEVLRDNLTINLGADILYSSGTAEGEESKIYAYPKVNASYVLIDEVLTAYAGIIGGLHQNTFNDFTNENPFVSPTLSIKRTDEQYNGFVGFKGKLASNIGYNFKATYKSENDKPFFKLKIFI